ncbi:hypothetical protein D3C78_1767300 [compost metagenome]
MFQIGGEGPEQLIGQTVGVGLAGQALGPVGIATAAQAQGMGELVLQSGPAFIA